MKFYFLTHIFHILHFLLELHRWLSEYLYYLNQIYRTHSCLFLHNLLCKSILYSEFHLLFIQVQKLLYQIFSLDCSSNIFHQLATGCSNIFKQPIFRRYFDFEEIFSLNRDQEEPLYPFLYQHFLLVYKSMHFFYFKVYYFEMNIFHKVQ